MVNASNANGDWGRLIPGLDPNHKSWHNVFFTNQQPVCRICDDGKILSAPFPPTHPRTFQHDDTFNQIQTRVFDPKGNETYVIARQADLTSLLWTITQTLTWTALTCFPEMIVNTSRRLQIPTQHQAQMVSYLSLFTFYIFSLYHDERDVYENTLEITVSDLRVGDDTNGYFWSLLYLNICMKILFRPQANVSKTQ